jgi:AcrR family transcriptional regulator
MNETEKENEKPQSGESRERILSAALEEFSQYGLAGSRMDRIAEAAGLNKAMLYYYFSSKEELHRAVITYYVSGTAGQVRQFAASTIYLEEMLLGIANLYFSLLTHRPQLRKLLLHELADDRKETLSIFAQSIINSGAPEELCKRFNAEIKNGNLRPVDVKQTVTSFFTMINGYILLSPITHILLDVTDQNAFREARKKAVVDLFMNGVRA